MISTSDLFEQHSGYWNIYFVYEIKTAMTKPPQLDKLPFLYAAKADIAQKAKSGTDQRTNAWWLHLIQR